MPERVASLVVLELIDPQLTILLERPRHVPKHAIDPRDERVVGEVLRNLPRYVERHRLPLGGAPDGAVGECDLDGIR